MATINEVLERAARVRPDAFDDETKARWLLELEGRIFREVIRRHGISNDPDKRQRPTLVECPIHGPGALHYIWQLDLWVCGQCGWDELPEYPKSFPEDGDMPLLVPAPYDRLYELWLFAQLDQANREIDNYNNSVELFNRAWADWASEYHRTHIPLQAGGIDAYGTRCGRWRGC